MKQQILEVLDKSTNNGMKAEEIMQLLYRRYDLVVGKWEDILSEDELSAHDILHDVAGDMICPEEDLNDGF